MSRKPTIFAQEQMAHYMERANINIDRLNVIHVAGSKGKGSVCAFTETILHKYGLKTGLYSSPHLVSITERFRINTKPVDLEIFLKYFWRVWDALWITRDQNGKFPAMPAYFTFLTLVGFELYVNEGVDVLVLEVGLGGKLDATNVVRRPLVTAVSTLALEHTEILGDTLTLIAREKAGIFKPGVPAFTCTQTVEAMRALEEVARDTGATLYVTRNLVLDTDTSNVSEMQVNPQGRHGIPTPPLPYSPPTPSDSHPIHRPLGLEGDFQRSNAALAVQIASVALRQIHELNGTKTKSSPHSQTTSEVSTAGHTPEYIAAEGKESDLTNFDGLYTDGKPLGDHGGNEGFGGIMGPSTVFNTITVTRRTLSCKGNEDEHSTEGKDMSESNDTKLGERRATSTNLTAREMDALGRNIPDSNMNSNNHTDTSNRDQPVSSLLNSSTISTSLANSSQPSSSSHASTSSLSSSEAPPVHVGMPLPLESSHGSQSSNTLSLHPHPNHASEPASLFNTHVTLTPYYSRLPLLFKQGLAETRWAGRCQVVPCPVVDNLVFYIDGAHTPISIELCAKWFRDLISDPASSLSTSSSTTSSSTTSSLSLSSSPLSRLSEGKNTCEQDVSKKLNTDNCVLSPELPTQNILLFNCGQVRNPFALLEPLVSIAYPKEPSPFSEKPLPIHTVRDILDQSTSTTQSTSSSPTTTKNIDPSSDQVTKIGTGTISSLANDQGKLTRTPSLSSSPDPLTPPPTPPLSPISNQQDIPPVRFSHVLLQPFDHDRIILSKPLTFTDLAKTCKRPAPASAVAFANGPITLQPLSPPLKGELEGNASSVTSTDSSDHTNYPPLPWQQTLLGTFESIVSAYDQQIQGSSSTSSSALPPLPISTTSSPPINTANTTSNYQITTVQNLLPSNTPVTNSGFMASLPPSLPVYLSMNRSYPYTGVCTQSVADSIAFARAIARSNPRVQVRALVTGSLYLVGNVLKALKSGV